MKRILKKTLTPLLALTMALGIGFSITNNREIMKASAAVETYTYTTGDGTWVDQPNTRTYSTANFTFFHNKNNGSNIATTYAELRVYAGHSMEVYPTIAGSKVIKYIEVTTSSDKYGSAMRGAAILAGENSGNATSRTGITSSTGTTAIFDFTSISNVGYVKFTLSSQARTTAWKITYDNAGATATYDSLSYTGTPITSYTAGDSFDPTGLTFNANFSDGTSQTIAHTDLVFSPTSLTTGTTSVSAFYTYDGVTKSTTITGITVSALAGSAATYTVTTTTSVATTGTTPAGSSAAFVNTASSPFQMTAGNSHTLTLSSYNSIRISAITLSVHSNQAGGAGYFAYSYDDVNYTNIISTSSFDSADWNGAYSTTFVSKTKTVDILVGGTIYFRMFATENSLYCQSYTFHWDAVPAGTLQSLNISKTSTTIYVGCTETLIATPVPANADGSVTWSTSSAAIATVNASGVVTAISNGTATITATSTVNTNISVSCTVYVESVVCYTKISNVADLKFGSIFTLGSAAYGVAAMYEPNTTTYIQRYTADFDVTNTKITDDDKTLKLVLEPGFVNDSFAFRVVGNNKYLTSPTATSTSNQITFSDSKTANDRCSWFITFDSSGNALIKSAVNQNRSIQYNSNTGQERFSTYTSTQKVIQMYVDLTTQTTINEATCYANEIMNGAGLGAQNICHNRVTLLNHIRGRMTTAAQSEFDSNTGALFVNARARKAYMDAWVIANPTAPLLREIKTNDTTTALIIISFFGISAIAGYYFFIKKKKFKL
ncbi:MAG: Ig-like domain-containing protein [Bacilli bacterium]|jgi:hypothetical protein|nr:Ig-like domain-containing protein [Bacilli bacterium]